MGRRCPDLWRYFALDYFGELFWGGPQLGAFCDSQTLTVSDISDLAFASVCGFPARLNMSIKGTKDRFLEYYK